MGPISVIIRFPDSISLGKRCLKIGIVLSVEPVSTTMHLSAKFRSDPIQKGINISSFREIVMDAILLMVSFP